MNMYSTGCTAQHSTIYKLTLLAIFFSEYSLFSTGNLKLHRVQLNGINKPSLHTFTSIWFLSDGRSPWQVIIKVFTRITIVTLSIVCTLAAALHHIRSVFHSFKGQTARGMTVAWAGPSDHHIIDGIIVFFLWSKISSLKSVCQMSWRLKNILHKWRPAMIYVLTYKRKRVWSCGWLQQAAID